MKNDLVRCLIKADEKIVRLELALRTILDNVRRDAVSETFIGHNIVATCMAALNLEELPED